MLNANSLQQISISIRIQQNTSFSVHKEGVIKICRYNIYIMNFLGNNYLCILWWLPELVKMLHLYRIHILL